MHRFLSIFLFAAAFFGSCFFISCENDPQTVNSFLRKQVVIENAYGVESYLSQGGKVRAKLTAPFMKRYVGDSPYIEFNKTLHVDFYDSSLQVQSILDAQYARHFEFERKVLLKDSIRIIQKVNGDTMYTSLLWWDQNTQEFHTDKPVRIFQRNGYTYGRNGMRAKQDFSEWWILGSSGERNVSDSSGL